MTTRFKIGQKYIPVGRKNKYVCTITDILKTYNSKNDLIKICYVSTHEFLGQIVTDHDVADSTIARGLINETNKN